MVRPLVDSTVNWIDPEHCAPSELSPQLSMPLHMPTLSMHWPLPHMEMQVPSRHQKVSVCSVRGSSNPHARGNCAPQWHRFWHVKDGRHSCTINANKGRCASCPSYQRKQGEVRIMLKETRLAVPIALTMHRTQNWI